MNIVLALTMMAGCNTSSETSSETSAEGAAAASKEVSPAKAGKRRGKAKRPAMEPVGVKGLMEGALALAPAEAEEGKGPRTAATLNLTWGDGGRKALDLGAVPGTCTEIEPQKVGREGHESEALWSVRCERPDEAEPTDLSIVQMGALLLVVQTMNPPADKPDAKPRLRPVRRVPLVRGAELQRKGAAPVGGGTGEAPGADGAGSAAPDAGGAGEPEAGGEE